MVRALAIIFGWFIFVIVGGSVLVGLCARDASVWAVISLYLALLCSPVSFLFIKEI